MGLKIFFATQNIMEKTKQWVQHQPAVTQKWVCTVASHNIPQCEQRGHLGKAILQIIELEDRVVEITAVEQNKEKGMKRR